MEHERDTRIETVDGGDEIWWQGRWHEVLSKKVQSDWVRLKVDADDVPHGEREFIFRPGFFVAAKIQNRTGDGA